MSKIKAIMERKNERKSLLLRALDSIVNQLKGMGALRIILFGSLVRGDVGTHSDIDLFVLMPSSKTGREWTNLIYEKVERKVASNIVVFNQEEFERQALTSSFIKNVLNGRIIYEKAA